jgi:hypothetical protein
MLMLNSNLIKPCLGLYAKQLKAQIPNEIVLVCLWPKKANMNWNCARHWELIIKIVCEAVVIFALCKLLDFPTVHPDSFLTLGI